MATPENRVKIWLDQELKKKYPGIWRYAPPGGFFGLAGIPDRFYLYKGVFVAIEVKATYNAPTELQLKRLKEIHEAGGIVAVMRGKDFDKLRRIYDRIDERVKRCTRV